ncbi:hypothetical protein NUSPORA_01579 [Nucleospora cyclopteri]
MIFELNINESTAKKLSQDKNCNIKGCVVTEITSKDDFKKEQLQIKNFYSRVNVSEQFLTYDLRKKFDLICVKAQTITSRTIKFQPDIIDLTSANFIKKSLINICKTHNIFIELNLNEAENNKLEFLTKVRRLIKYRAHKILVFSSGIQSEFDIRTENEVKEVLRAFNVKDREIKKILKNNEQVLRKAALKKFSYRETIIALDQKSTFLDDFIINYHI